ncbi:hypothetical protein AK88_04779 [Plasmodium fragile]|uniref:Uncharacterized protein n=1 Tax=Plasmodium fragile TaxID=5857 RepID=A0A0D9QF43_PLAFR|nr:uncharacterized protein AK88_04779 [Plasmodium fragile]KJP85609.1 hypothetical protein AK88_04779 [Plasmodium fragile]
MNFFLSKPNIRSTKSEVIHKANNNNVSDNTVNSNNVSDNNVGGNNVGDNHVGSHHPGSHHIGSHNVGHNGRMPNDPGSSNFLLENNNGYAYSNCDADGRSEIHYSNKAYDPQYSMYMNKIANEARSTRNHTSTHRIYSPRSQSINIFAPKVNRTSNISRNFDDRMSNISFYTNNKKKLNKTSILESNDSFKTQPNSQIVEQSLDLLKHLVHQENREQYLCAHENDKKNKLILKLIDQAKRNDERVQGLQTECASNNSIDSYQKRMDMLHLKFMKLKYEYSHLNNENVILKKQIRNIKDSYHMINPKSATVSFPRGPIPEEALRSNDTGNASSISNMGVMGSMSNVNNEHRMIQQQGGRVVLNKTTSINTMQQPVIPPFEKKKLVDCQVQTECTLTSPIPDRPDDNKMEDPQSAFNVSGNNLNSNLLNDNYLSELREQIRNEVTQEITNKLEQKYKDELLMLRQTIENNKMQNENMAEEISIDNVLNNTKHKLDEQINETINKYKNSLVDHFKELINAASEGRKSIGQMHSKGDGNVNGQANTDVDNVASLSINDKINECISLFESIIQKKINAKKIKEKKEMDDSTSIISALNNINTDINDIDDMMDKLHATVGQTHFSDDAESSLGEVDLLGKATSVSDDLELEEEASRRSLSGALESGGEGELQEEVTTGMDKARKFPKRSDNIGDNVDGPMSIRSDGPASVLTDGGTSSQKGKNSTKGDSSHRSNFHVDSPLPDNKIDLMGNMTMEINPYSEESAEVREERSSDVRSKNVNMVMHHSESGLASGNHTGVHTDVHWNVLVDHNAGGEANGHFKQAPQGVHNTRHIVEGMAEQSFNNEQIFDREEGPHNLAPNDIGPYDNPKGDFPTGKDNEDIPTESPDDKNKDSVDTEKEKKKSKWKNIFSTKKTKKKNLSDNFGNDTELWSKNENDEKNVKGNANDENFYNSTKANNTLPNNVQIEEGEIDVITNGVNDGKQIEIQSDAHKFASAGYPGNQPFMHPSGDGNGEMVAKSAYGFNKGEEELHHGHSSAMMNNALSVNRATHHYGGSNLHTSNDNHFNDKEKFNHPEINPYHGSNSRTQMNPFNHENGNSPQINNTYNTSNGNSLYMYQSNNEKKNGPNYNAKGDYAVNYSVYSYNPAANNKTGVPSPSEERYEEKPFYKEHNNNTHVMNNTGEVHRNDNVLFIENNNSNFAKATGTSQNSQNANLVNVFRDDMDGNKGNNGLNRADNVNNQYDFFYNLNDTNEARPEYCPWGHQNKTACISSYNGEGQFGEMANIKRVSSSTINMTKNTSDLTQNGQVKLSTKSEVHYNTFKAQKNKTKKNLEDLFA